jgi:hypothetical protein
MNAGVNGEGGRVDRPAAFNYLSLVIHSDQVGYPHQAEVESEGIDPEGIREFRIARRYVTNHTLVESEFREQAEARRQSLLSM